MNEAETRAEHIDPALKAAGWGVVEGSKVLREYRITEGRLQGAGQRGKPEIADYVLVYRGHKLAVVEAKRWDLPYTEGLAQAKSYAHKIHARFGYATNGQRIYGVDMHSGAEGDVAVYPSPQALWDMTFAEIAATIATSNADSASVNKWRERFAAVPVENKGGLWDSRYYQDSAIDAVLEAVAANQQRILLTLATGTGKTYIAFQLAWKLFHARWNLQRDATRRPRILFLADRNILANQAFNSFSPFAEDALVRIAPADIRKKGGVPKNGSVFFTIFQTFASTGSATDASKTDALFDIDELESLAEVGTIQTAYGYMYILQCADNSFYVGSTRNLESRIDQHNCGEGSKHTKARCPVKLVYYETFDRIDEAFAREKQVQGWSRAKKIALINGNTDALPSLSASTGSPAGSVEGAVTEPVEVFGEYPPDFFDFIIIDECHRGGANDESSWRGILDYFAPAVQLGLTATPKRRDNADTYAYFGEPVFVYSLKEGINDGFLTPFRVKQYATTLDEYRYSSDDNLIEGDIEAGKLYEEQDFNRSIEIVEREKYRVDEFMRSINPHEKTLVFCANQKHALLVRDLINQAKTGSTDVNYCVRVTADDGERGEQFLRDFQDNEKSIPTILTTSQKLSTGVDARNVRNIVLMRPINSMIEFKQIIGRGTRLYNGKEYFTIYDFVRAHKLFNDPEWDGEPAELAVCSACQHSPCVCIKEPRPACYLCGQVNCICDKTACAKCGQRPCACKKVRVKLRDGKEREIRHIAVTTFWGEGGKPISAGEFMALLFGELPAFFQDEDQLRELWSDPDTRKKLLTGLLEKGFGKAQLAQMQNIVDADHSDLFDVLAYVGFHSQLLSREQRAAAARSVIHQQFGDKQQAFLDFVLAHYVQQGVEELASEKLSELLRLKYHDSIPDAVADLGGDIGKIRHVFAGFQRFLYQQSGAPRAF